MTARLLPTARSTPARQGESRRRGTSVRTKLCGQAPSWRVVPIPKSKARAYSCQYTAARSQSARGWRHDPKAAAGIETPYGQDRGQLATRRQGPTGPRTALGKQRSRLNAITESFQASCYYTRNHGRNLLPSFLGFASIMSPLEHWKRLWSII
jgi:hypothetical protein